MRTCKRARLLAGWVLVGLAMSVAAVPAASSATAAAGTATVGPNINLTAAPGNQAETAVAIDPSNPDRAFMVAMDDRMTGLGAARTTDGGVTWTRSRVATGGGGMPLACCDPSVSWDSFGNLFLSYINAAFSSFTTVVAVSWDGGASFHNPVAVGTLPDQPTIATGPGSVWVTYSGQGGMWAAGAAVTGLGAIGAFFAPAPIPDTTGLSYGDVTVGPDGQVLTANGPALGSTGGTIVVMLSSGLGHPFGPGVTATTTGVGGFLALPAQPNRGTDSEAGLAYDRSGGPHTGRVYLVYADANPAGSANTDIFVRFSDDNGASWSTPARVNDDTGTASQFLPRISLDETSGTIAVSWHDARNDPANVSTQLFAAFSTDFGASFSPNIQVSAGTSDAAVAPPWPAHPTIDYGDYSANAFAAGRLLPVWADNSNATADNPDGTFRAFDIYTAVVTAPTPPTPVVRLSLPAPGATGWYTSAPVTGTVSATTPAGAVVSLTCPGATLGSTEGLGTPTATAVVAVSQQGVSTLACSATSDAGRSGSSVGYSVMLDSGAPVLAPSFTPATQPFPLSAVVTATPNATDPLLDGFASGVASQSCGPVDTASAGAKTLACTAADVAGNVTTNPNVGYVVGYAVAITSPGPGDKVHRGDSITVRFQLRDASGTPIPDTLAGSLGCSVTAGMAGGPSICAAYSASSHSFVAVVQTARTADHGAATLTVSVVSGGTVLGTASVDIRVIG